MIKLLSFVHQYDVLIFIWLVNRKITPALNPIAFQISRTADGFLYSLFIALLWKYKTLETPYIQAIFLCLVIERSLYFILKNKLKRHRPAVVLEGFQSAIIASDEFSLPSGHTSAAFMDATLIGAFAQTETDFPVMTLLYVWAMLVGLSRINLGVHFPSDILAGAALGVGTAFFTLGLFNL
jgi:undecaprenyl-diphosphatase